MALVGASCSGMGFLGMFVVSEGPTSLTGGVRYVFY